MEMQNLDETINAMADRLRQIEIELAGIRQRTVSFGVGVNTPYGELLDAGGLVLSAANRLRKLTMQEERAPRGEIAEHRGESNGTTILEKPQKDHHPLPELQDP